MFHFTDLCLPPMKACGVRPITTIESVIDGGGRFTSLHSTRRVRHISFIRNQLGFSFMRTDLLPSRRLKIASTAEMDQAPRRVPAPKGAKSSHNTVEVAKNDRVNKTIKIKGTVVLMKKNVLDFNDFHASLLDRVHEFLGQGVSLQLISADNVDPGEFALSS